MKKVSEQQIVGELWVVVVVVVTTELFSQKQIQEGLQNDVRKSSANATTH